MKGEAGSCAEEGVRCAGESMVESLESWVTFDFIAMLCIVECVCAPIVKITLGTLEAKRSEGLLFACASVGYICDFRAALNDDLKTSSRGNFAEYRYHAAVYLTATSMGKIDRRLAENK